LAFSKEDKQKILSQYDAWLKSSRAVLILEYKKLDMKTIDGMRARAREAGGEFHVAKNTLLEQALNSAGYKGVAPLTGTTLCAFAFDDAPAMAKVVADMVKESKEELFKIKSGYLDGLAISAAQVKALADLPPLPVMRATLLGTILAPASKLVRTLAEPGRMVAAVLKAHSEQDAVPA
jgi:large subunit ribosomal protein L10